MTRIFFSIIFISLAIWAGYADADCIQGHMPTQTIQRKIEAFDTVNINGAFTASIICQQPQKVHLTGQADILPYVKTILKDRILYIYMIKSICTYAPLEIRIYTPCINTVAAFGANDIHVSQLNSQNFEMNVDGAGDVYVSGKTNQFRAFLDGAVEMHAKNLISKKTNINLSGAGDAEIWASEKLVIDISGAGDVYYYGSPEKIFRAISGVGEIIRQD